MQDAVTRHRLEEGTVGCTSAYKKSRAWSGKNVFDLLSSSFPYSGMYRSAQQVLAWLELHGEAFDSATDFELCICELSEYCTKLRNTIRI